MTRIFISYRRGDARKEAEALYNELSKNFGGEVFWDMRRIEDGDHWEEVINDALSSVEVMFVLIGPNWLRLLEERVEAEAQSGERDWVHYEIRKGFEKENCRIVPILFADTEFLKAKDLPEDIRMLARLQPRKFGEYRNGRSRLSPPNLEVLVNAVYRYLFVAKESQSAQQISTLRPNSGYENENEILKELENLEKNGMLQLSERLLSIVRDAEFGENPRQTLPDISDDTYQELLLDIIQIVGRNLYDYEQKVDLTTQEDKQTAYERLLVLLKVTSRNLALEDKRRAETKPNNPQIRTGYERILEWFYKESDYTFADQYTAQHALAIYEEYHKPERLERSKPDSLKFRVMLQQGKNTWNEFVSDELIGAILIAVLIALMLAIHNLMIRNFMPLRPPFGLSEGADSCWYFMLNAQINFSSCWRGLTYEILAWIGIIFICLGIYDILNSSVQVSRHLGRWLPRFLLGVFLLALSIYLLANDPLNNIGEIGLLKFLYTFLGTGAITLPGTLLTLALNAWSSVVAGERKTRSVPKISFRLTALAMSFGLIITVILLAIIIEKSQQSVPDSMLLAVAWALSLSVGISVGRNALPRWISSENRKWFWRFGMMLVFSVAFTIGYGYFLAWWPNGNEFLNIPGLVGLSMDFALVDSSNLDIRWLQNSYIGMSIARLSMLGIWLATAFFFGMEIMNHKMYFVRSSSSK